MQTIARGRTTGSFKGRALFAISLVSLAGFAGLALLVRFSLTARVDALAERVAARLDGPAVALVGGLLTELGRIEWTLLLAMIAAAWLWWRGQRPLSLAVLLIFATVAIEVLSKELLFVPRWEIEEAARAHPRRLPSEVVDLITYPNDAWYPSGHMARSVFLCGLVARLVGTRRRSGAAHFVLGAGMVLFLAAMGFTRITEGEHPLSDVIGGTLLGMALLPPAWWLIERDRGRIRR
jgi:membrane-associated phospholipid phosphatase